MAEADAGSVAASGSADEPAVLAVLVPVAVVVPAVVAAAGDIPDAETAAVAGVGTREDGFAERAEAAVSSARQERIIAKGHSALLEDLDPGLPAEADVDNVKDVWRPLHRESPDVAGEAKAMGDGAKVV